MGRNCPLDWTVENFETHHSAIQAINARLFDLEIGKSFHRLVNLGEGACQLRTPNCFVISVKSSLRYDTTSEQTMQGSSKKMLAAMPFFNITDPTHIPKEVLMCHPLGWITMILENVQCCVKQTG